LFNISCEELPPVKISCPQCGASGNLPDHEIPEEGRFLSCPKCKHGFDVKKPKATTNEYLVDVCPACAYSTFGDERFGTCPKCGVFIKTFIDRQREEMARAREQEILNRKFSRDSSPPPAMPMPGNLSSSPSSSAPAPKAESSIDIGEFIENLHPVNLIGYGTALVAVVILLMAIFGMFDYYGTDYQAKISDENVALGIEERASALKIFLYHGLVPWIEMLYGASLLAVAVFFLQKQAQARQALGWLLWALIAYVPTYYIVSISAHFFEPSRPTFGTFAFEFLQMVVVSVVVGFPLFLLIEFLEDKRIRSVVKL
jgi:predicted Zn finger-like uncharacterized protein